MRVVVLGAGGAVGAAVVDALLADPTGRVDAVIAIDLRLPAEPQSHVDWRELEGEDAARALTGHLQGADAVVNAFSGTGAGRGEESRGPRGAGRPDERVGIEDVLEALVEAGVRHLVQMSSFAAYAPVEPGHDPVDESWPIEGVADVPYARRAVALERLLDKFGNAHPAQRVVRLRPGLVLGPRALADLLRGLGPLASYYRAPGRLPLLPGVEGSLPVVHHDDLATAACAAVTGSSVGAYNLAMDAVLDLRSAAKALGARPVTVPEELVRIGSGLAGTLLAAVGRDPGEAPGAWLRMARGAPRLATWRARQELGWVPVHPLDEAFRATLSGRT